MAKNTVGANGQSIVTEKSGGQVTCFPNVCKTPVGSSVVPIPYPSVAKSGDLKKGSKTVKIGGASACLKGSNLSKSIGDEAGTAKGIASSKQGGIAEPVNFSFNVKIEGKNVVRAMDPFISNNKNTPPGPIIQGPVVAVNPVLKVDEIEEPKCDYCGKPKSECKMSNMALSGNNDGNSSTLANNIFKGRSKSDHPWYIGGFSIAAHHLICSEAMKGERWEKYCDQFGYNINDSLNGVMLPMKMELACQIGAPLHKSKHSKGIAGNTSYPAAVKNMIKEIQDGIEAGEFCDDPEAAREELEEISEVILGYINAFTWTITADGKDYKRGTPRGCAGSKSIPKKPSVDCPYLRKHDLRHATTGNIIPVKTTDLQIGE